MVVSLDKSQSSGNCLTLPGISWEKFEQLEIIFSDVEGIKFAYLDGDLEIVMSPSKAHEEAKSTIALLLESFMRAKKIRFYAMGSLTLGTREIKARKEPDESYSIQVAKEIPDLVIEVIITSGSVNILEIYRRLGVPEVWLYKNGLLNVYVLKDDQYSKLSQSQLLPDLDLQIFTKYINYSDQYDAVTEFIDHLRVGNYGLQGLSRLSGD